MSQVPLIVVYDACVLYSAPLRDLFMYLALADIYQAKWTKDIHDEWMRNLLKNRPDLTKGHLEKVREKMDTAIEGCLVQGYEGLIEKITLPDLDDRHVLAAAIQAHAQIIITFNLVDFPYKATAKYNIEAQHPDQFLRDLLEQVPAKVIQAVRKTRLSLKHPPKTAEAYLDILINQSLPQTVKYLFDYKDLI